MIHTTPLYARAWRACATVWVVVGLLLVALHSHEPSLALRAGLVIAVTAALVSWAFRVHRSDPVPGLFPRVLRDGLQAGLAVAACCGWTSLIGPGGLVSLPLLLALSPPVAGWLARQMRAEPVHHAHLRAGWSRARRAADRPTGEQAEQPAGEQPVETMTTRQIAAVWRWSGSQLPHVARSCQHAGLVRLRQRCLDELERRDAPALLAWLGSDPAVSSDPTAYFVREQ